MSKNTHKLPCVVVGDWDGSYVYLWVTESQTALFYCGFGVSDLPMATVNLVLILCGKGENESSPVGCRKRKSKDYCVCV